MAQNGHFVSNNSNSGSGCGDAGGSGGGGGGGGKNDKSKNGKPKKVPQRGLGVAQLERIRLEEQRRREALQAANVFANNAISETNVVSLQPPPPPPPANLFASPSFLFRSDPSAPIDHTADQSNGRGRDLGLVDRRGFLFGSNLNLESNTPAVIPNPGAPHYRSWNFPRPNSSMVIASQNELPSFQNARGHNNVEDDKILGEKRSYPFSLETPPAPSFLSLAASSSEPTNKRNGSSSSTTPVPDSNPNEDVRLSGDFLRLAPPTADDAPPQVDLKNKRPLDYFGLPGLESSNGKILASQENSFKSQAHQPAGSSALKEQAFSFFPMPRADETASNDNGEEEEEEGIDLELKL